MDLKLPKISVIIISYNQENLIRRSLNSVLNQKEFLYEVVVSDDFSQDSTWDVIMEYYKIFPKFIKPFRNNSNLGIFGNIENTWNKPKGDMITYLAGDDELCAGYLEACINFLTKNNLDYLNNAICIYSDFIIQKADGQKKYFSNHMISKYDPISLKIRNLIFNRTTVFSKMVLEKFTPIRKDIGIFADGLIDIQTQMYSMKNYYLPLAGSIYFAHIGISTSYSKKQNAESYKLYVSELLNMNLEFNHSDILYLKFLQAKFSFLISLSFKQYLNYLKHYVLSFNLIYGINFQLHEIKQLVKNFRFIFK